MKNYYSFVLLIFGAFAVTTTSGYYPIVTPEFEAYQKQVDDTAEMTYNTFTDLHTKISRRRESLKRQLTVDVKIEEDIFKAKDTEALERAIKQGKEVTKIRACIKSSQEKHWSAIMNSHKKAVNCVVNACNFANEKIKGARKNFDWYSFAGAHRNAENDYALHRCYVPLNSECEQKKVAEYKEKIRVTKVVSKQYISESKTIYKTMYKFTNNCVATSQKEFAELEKKHDEFVAKCINDDDNNFK